jgi:twinfilin-like protein
VRDLGSENFATTVFTTEEEEVLSEQVWRERDIEGNGGNGRAGFKREDVMDERERELEAVRRAEEEASRDAINRGTLGKNASGGMNFAMPVDEDARGALKGLGEGGMVQLVCSILPFFVLLYLVFFFGHVYFRG